MATVRERNGSYQIRVSAGYDLTGRQITRTHTWKPEPNLTARQTQKELQRQTVAFEKQVMQGYVIDEKLTFAEYAQYAIATKERMGAKRKTIEEYKGLLPRIIAAIGHLKLASIRPAHLNDFYTDLGKVGMNKKTGGKLSAKTIIEYHRLISTILAQAEKEMLIPFNPAHRATPPKQVQKAVNYFQIEEISAIRDALEVEPIKWKTATHLLLVSGCRRGEVMGLKWAKVDFANATIRIDSTLSYSAPEHELYSASPKTATSVRTIKLPAETMILLKRYRAWQAEQQLMSGDQWQYTDYLFTQEKGTPMHPDSLNTWLARFAKRNGLPHINPHAFRHSMASVLYFNGVDSIAISKRLGHSKVSTTADIYAHILKESDERAADCIGEIMLGAKKA